MTAAYEATIGSRAFSILVPLSIGTIIVGLIIMIAGIALAVYLKKKGK